MKERGQQLAPERRRAGRPAKLEQREDARDALLKAAHLVMKEKNSIEVSSLEIAQRASLNPTLVNYYFKSKDNLLVEIAFQNQDRIASSLDRLMSKNMPAIDKLKIHIRAVINSNREIPYLKQLHQKLLRGSDGSIARQYGVSLLTPLALFYRALVEQGKKENSFKNVDPMLLYFTILGTCDSFIFTGISLKYAFNDTQIDDALTDAYINHTIDIVTTGVLRSAPEISTAQLGLRPVA